jgi:phage tail tape-measure protein
MIRVLARTASIAIGALVLCASLQAPAFATQYSLNGNVYASLRDCENAMKTHGVVGSVVGGAAGALLGSSISGHNHGVGSGVGAVAGATIGGREADRGTCRPVAAHHTYASTTAAHYQVGDCAMGADKLYAPSGQLVTTRAVRLCLTGAGWATSP